MIFEKITTFFSTSQHKHTVYKLWRLKDISTPDFSTQSFNPSLFNPRLVNHELFNPGLFNREFLNHGVEKFSTLSEN